MRVTRSVIPNLFTLANLFCGFAAIVACFEGHLDRAALLIVTAGVFDMLDGVVARITRSTSEFGVELDSLCDAVSFGVAPSAMLYQAMFHDWHQWGLLLASLPALAGVLRLARFNVQLTSMEDKLYFRGMPIPAGAFMIVSFLALWLPSNELPEAWKPGATAAVTVFAALAMVSTIKYDNLPRPSLKSLRQRPVVFSVFFIALVASVITGGKALFPFMIVYLIGGAIRHLVVFLRDRSEQDDSIEEDDPDPFTM